jgi:uncharacterized protein YwlG (UPF0340 family)
MADPLKDDHEVVLERIMANGTFDELRKQLLENLRTDVRSHGLEHAFCCCKHANKELLLWTRICDCCCSSGDA